MAFPVNKRNEDLRHRADLLRSKATRSGKIRPLTLHLSQNRSGAILSYSIAVVSGGSSCPQSISVRPNPASAPKVTARPREDASLGVRYAPTPVRDTAQHPLIREAERNAARPPPEREAEAANA